MIPPIQFPSFQNSVTTWSHDKIHHKVGYIIWLNYTINIPIYQFIVAFIVVDHCDISPCPHTLIDIPLIVAFIVAFYEVSWNGGTPNPFLGGTFHIYIYIDHPPMAYGGIPSQSETFKCHYKNNEENTKPLLNQY